MKTFAADLDASLRLVNVWFLQAARAAITWELPGAGPRQRVGSKVVYEDLAQIEKLVHNLRDVVALVCLEEGPLRYSDLGREMSAWSDQHVSEAEVTRARHRLINGRMISIRRDRAGHQVYVITERGRHRLAQIRILVQAIPRLQAAGGSIDAGLAAVDNRAHIARARAVSGDVQRPTAARGQRQSGTATGAVRLGSAGTGVQNVAVNPADDTDPATAAGIYDYHLGGAHNSPADRRAAEAIIAANPMVPAMARATRAFLRRTVSYLVEQGIRQFLDVGSGIPTVGNVHEIAQNAAPDARVLYIDIDPAAVGQAQQLLAGNDRATAIVADLRRPDNLLSRLASPDLRRIIEPDQPTGLILNAVLQFVPQNAHAYAVVKRLREYLAPGSYVVISHGTTVGWSPEQVTAVLGTYQQWTSTPGTYRDGDQIKAFFDGLQLVDPGLVWIPKWRPAPQDPQDFAEDPETSSRLGGVGYKP